MFYNKSFLFIIALSECSLLLRWPFKMSQMFYSIPNIIIPFSVIALFASSFTFFQMSMFGQYGKSHDIWKFCIFCRKIFVLLYYIRTRPFFSFVFFVFFIQRLCYLITDKLFTTNLGENNSQQYNFSQCSVQIIEYMFNVIMILIMLKNELRICLCVLICKYIFLDKNTKMYILLSNLYLLTVFTFVF